MPIFQTPEPISVTVELVVGDTRITAGDRLDTIVEVRPRDAANAADNKAAEQTRVEYAGGRLLVKAPRSWRQYSPFRSDGTVDVTIDLPTGSRLDGDVAMGKFHAEGELGQCRLKAGMGDIRLDHTGPLHVHASYGDIAVDHATGEADVTTGSGDVRIGGIDGPAMIKNSNGDTEVGDVTGDLRVKAANGDIAVDRARRSVTAKTARGDIRIGDVERGVIVLETAVGELEIGVHDGTAAWLDLSTKFGTVRSSLEAGEGPEQSDAVVEVRGQTAVGDIVIRRAPARHDARSSRARTASPSPTFRSAKAM